MENPFRKLFGFMYDESGMLTDQARGILFWVTVGLIAIVAILILMTIVSSCSQLISSDEVLAITPEEATVCTTDEQVFSVSDTFDDVTWEANGGSIDENGVFIAGVTPGEYEVTASSGRQTAQAIVHVRTCAPTATPTPDAAAEPTSTPTPETQVSAADDAQGDVTTYEGNVPGVTVPAGLDIRSASVGPEMRVVLQPTEGIPESLAGFAGEGDVLLWITLHEPLPEGTTDVLEWFFPLDLDGDSNTGRPPNSSRTGMDAGLGDDVVLSVRSDAGTLSATALVWVNGDWSGDGPEVRYQLDDSRTVIGMAVSYDALNQAAAVTIVPEAVQGRAAAVSYDPQLVDLYP